MPSSESEHAAGSRFHHERARARWTDVEIIEAKLGLNEAVVGQLMVGRWMLAEETSLHATRSIALVRHVDPAMEWVARQLRIDVERVPLRRKPNNPMQGRPRYGLASEDLMALQARRSELAGCILTRVPLGGDRAGPTEWKGSVETYLPYLRLPAVGSNDIRVCHDVAHAREMIDGREVEVVVLATAGVLGRGAVGRALAHRLMVGAQYRPARVSATILSARPDPAIAAAAAHFDVRVLGL